ncbi:SDR family oxidoreductase [Chloroflexota bacterium]
MQRVLVAGSTGYLGRYVVQEFKERGYWVRVLARNPKKLEQTGPFLEPSVIDKVDETFTGKVTRPATLYGLCDDIDIVFSSIGITRQKDKLTYRDVDYQGNRNILDIAIAKSVRKFIYVSVFNAHLYEYLEIVKAHEDFVRDLQSSGLNNTIIRPTGYFSDMTEFLKMAKSGRVYLIGNEENKINPIHGADLAKVCVDAVDNKENEVAIGGPVIYSGREIAKLALSTLGKKPKITRIPLWLAKAAVKVVRPFNKQMAGLADFFIAAGEGDGVAPITGEHTLVNYYRELVATSY